MRRLLTLLSVAALACAVSSPAVAEAPTKDAKQGVYVPYGTGGVNIRVDKIERIAHVDNGVFAKDQDAGDGTTGYVVFSLSVQNAGKEEAFMPTFWLHLLMDDQSDVSSDILGPFVGAGRADAPARLQPKQSIKIRFALFGVPADRKITKILFNPNDGGAHYRFQIGASDIVTTPEVPRPPAE